MARTYAFVDCGCAGATGASPCNPAVSTDACEDCSAPPVCSIECIASGTIYTCRPPFGEGEPPEGVCESSEPSRPCNAIYAAAFEACGGTCGPTLVTVQARAVLTGLTIGTSYTVTLYLIDPGTLDTTTIGWTFTATGPTETTSYAAFPTPDITNQTWVIDTDISGGCEIEEAA